MTQEQLKSDYENWCNILYELSVEKDRRVENLARAKALLEEVTNLIKWAENKSSLVLAQIEE